MPNHKKKAMQALSSAVAGKTYTDVNKKGNVSTSYSRQDKGDYVTVEKKKSNKKTKVKQYVDGKLTSKKTVKTRTI